MTTERLDYEVGGLAYRRRADGIHEFRVFTVNNASVDAWYETVMAIARQARHTDEHVRTLYHVEGLWPTPYAAQRIINVNREVPRDLRLSTAILLDDNAISVVIVQGLIRQLPTEAHKLVHIFFQVGEALHWLEERRKLVG